MNLKGMTGHIYKKINALFENAPFQSDTNSTHPSQLKDLILESTKKLKGNFLESESGMFLSLLDPDIRGREKTKRC